MTKKTGSSTTIPGSTFDELNGEIEAFRAVATTWWDNGGAGPYIDAARELAEKVVEISQIAIADQQDDPGTEPTDRVELVHWSRDVAPGFAQAGFNYMTAVTKALAANYEGWLSRFDADGSEAAAPPSPDADPPSDAGTRVRSQTVTIALSPATAITPTITFKDNANQIVTPTTVTCTPKKIGKQTKSVELVVDFDTFAGPVLGEISGKIDSKKKVLARFAM